MGGVGGLVSLKVGFLAKVEVTRGTLGAFVEKPPGKASLLQSRSTEAKQVARVPGDHRDVSYKARICKVGAKQHLKHKLLITLLATGKARHSPRQMHRRNVLGCRAGTLVHTALEGHRQSKEGALHPLSLSLRPRSHACRKPLQPGSPVPLLCNSPENVTTVPHHGLTQRSCSCRHSKCLCELQTGSSYSKLITARVPGPT